MHFDIFTAIYVGFFLIVVGLYSWSRGQADRSNRARKAAAIEAGLHEPPTLHPAIDPVKCIGCGACVAACPEGGILGLIGGKADLVEPSECIGHGACKAACPVGAISLVFGTETRGVELPHVRPNFESNVPGLFLAGEIGGMGLIRNAIEQGRQAIAEVAKRGRSGAGYDVIIVGAGPAGISASLGAQQLGLSSLTIEQEALGGAVTHYPRGKLVMTQPATLPIHGKVKFSDVDKETLLQFWTDIAQRHRLNVAYGERVSGVRRTGQGFSVTTTARSVEAHSVLLCIGRRGTPRLLNVPGEEQSKVVYRLVDPTQYDGQDVIVVGGGDSALEAAASLCEESRAQVILVHRGDAFGRARPRNRQRVERAAASGRLRVCLGAHLTGIWPDRVSLEMDGTAHVVRNDAVIVCAGGILPTDFLRDAGIQTETRRGEVR